MGKKGTLIYTIIAWDDVRLTSAFRKEKKKKPDFINQSKALQLACNQSNERRRASQGSEIENRSV